MTADHAGVSATPRVTTIDGDAIAVSLGSGGAYGRLVVLEVRFADDGADEPPLTLWLDRDAARALRADVAAVLAAKEVEAR